MTSFLDHVEFFQTKNNNLCILKSIRKKDYVTFFFFSSARYAEYCILSTYENNE